MAASVQAGDGSDISASVGLGVRAELLLARGETDAGLRLWRQAVERLRDSETLAFHADPGREPWVLEVQALTVIAHAYAGRLGPVAEMADELTGRLAAILANPVVNQPPSVMELPLCGVLLLALGLAERDVRMIALAERFRFLRQFQPTMSAARARRAAEDTDGPAYADAVSRYAGLSHGELRAAALAVLRERNRH